MKQTRTVEVTEEMEREIRKRINSWLIASHKSKLKLHIPDQSSKEKVPLCNTKDVKRRDGWNKKTVNAYPFNWADICQYCGKKWQER